MRNSKVFLGNTLVLISVALIYPDSSYAKIKAMEKDFVLPTCTVSGEIECPKGFQPSCPEQYKPSCIFVLQKQHPACLADSADNTFYNYRLDKISCKKGK